MQSSANGVEVFQASDYVLKRGWDPMVWAVTKLNADCQMPVWIIL